jgi:hypothetical protein
MKLNKILGLGAACSILTLSAQAQEEEASPFSFNISLDANSHFMSYGANVWGTETEDIGDEWLFQPSASIDYAINDTSGLYVGAWFDINGVEGAGPGEVGPDLGGDTKEMDLWIGYWITAGDFTFDFTFQQWYYADEVEGIFDVTVSYDTLFSPYIKAHNRFECVGDQQKGTMFEVGGTLYEGEVAGIAYGFSAGVGFSLDDYHVAGEDGYAYSFLGASASYVIYSGDSLDIDVHGGLTYFDTDEDTTGNAEDSYLTANIGVGFSF